MFHQYRAVAERRGERSTAPKAIARNTDAKSKRRALWASAAFALVTTGSATAVSGGFAPILATAQQTIDLIAARSPGVRTVAIMGKGKGKGRARVRAPGPETVPDRIARALPRVIDRGRAPAVAPEQVAGSGGAALPPAVLPGAVVGPGAVLPAGVTPGGGGIVSPGFIFPPFTGISPPGGGGGGIFVPPPEQPTPPEQPAPPPETPPVVVVPPTPAPPIPEPATWASMMLGFGLLGAIIRRRGRVRLRHG